MLFSSMIFLWLFLPIVFGVSRLLPQRMHNVWLLTVSLLFYAWGEPIYVLLMLFSIAFNFAAGAVIDRASGNRRRLALAGAVVINLGLLGFFKYLGSAISLLGGLLGVAALAAFEVSLPIGISFYTFQILSYIIDLYRGEIKVQRNFLNLALYISFFPQLIAGPIVHYRDIEAQLTHRTISMDKTAYGIKRFLYGLAKKVLIANTLAMSVDRTLTLKPVDVPSGYIWLAYLLYSLQIYFDFSGYSDMAIGLGNMFGFDFLENFNYPYISRSVTEFWRRWHISLSSWFKSYLYIPLGGNRKGTARTCLNLLVVFALTGLWHGTGVIVSFLVWGLWHGAFLIIERFFLKKHLDRGRLGIFARLYTLLVVYFGWIFFRAGSFSLALETIRHMFAFAPGDNNFFYQSIMGVSSGLVAAVGIVVCGPFQAAFPRIRDRLFDRLETGYAQIFLLGALLFASIVSLASGSYNPFIYFRF
jgi:alginate O-acetyltransferase complex protein AlgI